MQKCITFLSTALLGQDHHPVQRKVRAFLSLAELPCGVSLLYGWAAPWVQVSLPCAGRKAHCQLASSLPPVERTESSRRISPS